MIKKYGDLPDYSEEMDQGKSGDKNRANSRVQEKTDALSAYVMIRCMTI